MVHVFHYRLSSGLPVPVFNAYLETLPPVIQKKIKVYRQWQDAERSLAGYMLLQKGLEIMNLAPVDLLNLRYGNFLKPYSDQVHFNISHSGDFTVCAISTDHEVGVDIEEIKPIPLADFTAFFNASEWNNVLESPDPVAAFYRLWTKKEAFLKFLGSGLQVPLSSIVLEGNMINWNQQQMVLQEINIDPTHICHLCTVAPAPHITSSAIPL